MSEPIWNQFLTERDKAVFGTSGYGARQGFGKRPALLIIDVNYAFCDERPMPILESIKRWRNSCGEDAWVAMPYLKSLIGKAHAKGIPVIYTTVVRRADNWDNGSWSWKNNRSDEDRSSRPNTNVDGNEIVAEIAPSPQDIVIYKQKPSGFFGTNMTSYLTLLGCDRHDDLGLRARHGARRLQPQLPHLARRGRLLRPLAGEPRDQSLRHERQVCRRGENRRGAGVLRHAAFGAIRPAEGCAGGEASLEALIAALPKSDAAPERSGAAFRYLQAPLTKDFPGGHFGAAAAGAGFGGGGGAGRAAATGGGAGRGGRGAARCTGGGGGAARCTGGGGGAARTTGGGGAGRATGCCGGVGRAIAAGGGEDGGGGADGAGGRTTCGGGAEGGGGRLTTAGG
jgi:nicotinamidase-related amidase